jgi:hypothetical protein
MSGDSHLVGWWTLTITPALIAVMRWKCRFYRLRCGRLCGVLQSRIAVPLRWEGKHAVDQLYELVTRDDGLACSPLSA